MPPDDALPPDEKDREARRIEREARLQSGADPLALIAGRDGGHLDGASPTPVLRRAVLEIEQWLREHLQDTAGALRKVMLRKMSLRGEQLEAGLGHPEVTVGEWLDEVLARPAVLAELVRQADMEWGRLLGERPHFEKDGEPPHPDDPYTIAGVTALFGDLRDRCRDR